MENMSVFIVVSTVVAGLAAIGIMFIFRHFRNILSSSLTSSYETLGKHSNAIEKAIEQAFSRINGMLPLDNLTTHTQELLELSDKLKKEADKLSRVEEALRKTQVTIKEKEARHNELKIGRENSTTIAAELKATREQLKLEHQNLEIQLKESQSQLKELSNNTEITEEQQKAITEIEAAYNLACKHLDGLIQVYNQASGRYLNLQGQHEMLELEYRGLVEKQLSGEL
ncbi:MAG: hypothetical protein IT291_11100 [Deltaproteobacteria bacterium]|nr:hypothetical protein [Deltaproteobacteria bacterium]